MTQTRPRVLMSAYACEPGKGSEPGVGWNWALAAAKHAEVWVITRANNRETIEAAGALPSSLHFEYYDAPSPWLKLKKGVAGISAYYYAWQLGIEGVAQRLHREIGFDLAHHITFVKYWAPSRLSRINVPVLWGPVGGGERIPAGLWEGLSVRNRSYEFARLAAQHASERDPLVRATARDADLAWATTHETALRVKQLGARHVEVVTQCYLSEAEESALNSIPPARPASPLRVFFAGRLQHFKGLHLAFEALARTRGVELVIAGDGPERANLAELARTLGIASRVTFLGRLPREETWQQLRDCQASLMLGLHESGGLACLESMAAGRPVVALRCGGPGEVVGEGGILVTPASKSITVTRLAEALQSLADSPDLALELGEQARKGSGSYTSAALAALLRTSYQRLLAPGR